jgi:hypothetical protein
VADSSQAIALQAATTAAGTGAGRPGRLQSRRPSTLSTKKRLRHLPAKLGASPAGECRRHMSFGDIELRVVCRTRPRSRCSCGWVVAIDNCRRQGDWDVKLRKLREFGPPWVRATPVERGISGHQSSRTVERNAGHQPSGSCSWDDVGRRFRLWSRRSGRRRRAADGQQPVSVTTGEPARKPWRIMTADPAIDGH